MNFKPLFILLVVVVFVFVSCKKDRTCLCGEKVNAVSISIYETKAKARTICNAWEESYKTDCYLK